MVKVNTFGRRDLTIWDISNMAIEKGLENGYLKNNKVKHM